MIEPADIEALSREEKFRMMDTLWDEISKEDPPPESPQWYQTLLEQTQYSVDAGKERTADWNEAKRRLRRPK
jgi:hypothetical protein